jgi:hypothetical protein
MRRLAPFLSILAAACAEPRPPESVLVVPTATATAVPPAPMVQSPATAAPTQTAPPSADLPCDALCRKVLESCPSLPPEKCVQECTDASKRVSDACRPALRPLIDCVLARGTFTCKRDDFDVTSCQAEQDQFRKCQSSSPSPSSSAPPPSP